MNKKMIFLLCAGLLSSQLAVGMDRYEEFDNFVEEIELDDNFFSKKGHEQVKEFITTLSKSLCQKHTKYARICDADEEKLKFLREKVRLFIKKYGLEKKFLVEYKKGVVGAEIKDILISIFKFDEFQKLLSKVLSDEKELQQYYAGCKYQVHDFIPFLVKFGYMLGLERTVAFFSNKALAYGMDDFFVRDVKNFIRMSILVGMALFGSSFLGRWLSHLGEWIAKPIESCITKRKERKLHCLWGQNIKLKKLKTE